MFSRKKSITVNPLWRYCKGVGRNWWWEEGGREEGRMGAREQGRKGQQLEQGRNGGTDEEGG